ncbi:MAG: oligosaccharide flippase family protein [Bacteroidales bacterium]|nr:oligosaccharide flippase family protein [Bacteroidales bacterium]
MSETLENIKRLIKHNLFRNFFSLSALQLFNLLLPILTYPYLIRVLGQHNYGMLIFANSIIQYFTIIINFGFNISATKDVSVNRKNINKLNEITNSVLLIKFIIFFVGLMILLCLTFFLFELSRYRMLILITYTICISEVIFPVWFFQGVEDMKFITYLNVFTKVFFTILIFIFVQSKDDYLKIPIFNSLGAFFGGIFALTILVKKYKIKFLIPSLSIIQKQITKSLPYFFSRVSAVITVETNIIIIANKMGFSNVAYYDLAKKIVNIMIIPINILNQVIFPSVVASKNMRLVKKSIILAFVYGLAVFFIIILFSESIITALGGKNMLPAKYLIWILCFSVPLSGIHYFLGNTVLVVKGYAQIFNRSVIYSMIFYLALVVLLFFTQLFSIYTIAIIVICSNIFDLAYRWYHVKKLKLLK